MNLYPTTIIENFYEDPDSIREFALSQDYTYCQDRNNYKFVYPGCRTKDIYDIDQKLHASICSKLISIFHNSEHDVMRWGLSTNFQSIGKKYKEGVIHTDGETIFAGVLFLSPDAPLDSGTSVFRKKNNFDEQRYKQISNENADKFRRGDPNVDLSYHDMFEEIVRINNVYNTLVVYEGQHFHSANRYFGDTIQNSRLTQVFFINSIDAQKYSIFPIKRLQNMNL